jgi:hypothetical protein
MRPVRKSGNLSARCRYQLLPGEPDVFSTVNLNDCVVNRNGTMEFERKYVSHSAHIDNSLTSFSGNAFKECHDCELSEIPPYNLFCSCNTLVRTVITNIDLGTRPSAYYRSFRLTLYQLADYSSQEGSTWLYFIPLCAVPDTIHQPVQNHKLSSLALNFSSLKQFRVSQRHPLYLHNGQIWVGHRRQFTYQIERLWGTK